MGLTGNWTWEEEGTGAWDFPGGGQSLGKGSWNILQNLDPFASTWEAAQGSARLPQSEELTCHCILQACKVLSRCFYKVVKDE